MNEETKLILENQKILLRCFLYDERIFVIKDEIQSALVNTNSILFPEEPESISEQTKDTLLEKNVQ